MMKSYSNTLLEKIVRSKKDEIDFCKARQSLQDLKSKSRDQAPPRHFVEVFDPTRFQSELPHLRIIAEIKKASPSAGLLRPVYDPLSIARDYLEAGAAALSVLTDPSYFQGALEDLKKVRAVSECPILRKDFMIDPYQIYEARAVGADCILAIVAILEKNQLEDFVGLAEELGMSTLVEVHEEDELKTALLVKGRAGGSVLLGINNRNLKTLVTDLATTERLMSLVPSDRLVISESGLRTHADLVRMQQAGSRGFLVGEHLLREKDIKKKFLELLNG